MPKPSKFITSTDYATLKNSQTGLTATVTVPSSAVIPAGSYLEWHTDIQIAESCAMVACRISSSKNSSRWLVGNTTDMIRTGSLSGTPTTYDIFVFVWRVSANTMRFQATINNPTYGSPLTCAAGDETFSLYMYTFVPPFV